MKNIKDDVDEFTSEEFKCLNLTCKDLSDKVFDSCIFKDCDFNEAVLDRSKFIDCHFIQCNLSLIKIEQSKFLDVFFEECKVIGVDWTSASWSNYTLSSPIKFYKSIINDSSFFGLRLEEIELEECKAHDVDFREGNFSEANFSYSDFTNCLFNKTNLTGVNFVEAINYNIDVYFNEITRAKFTRFEAIRLLDSLDVELVD
ncbi:MAG: pentapeptide repeat-containing protein [Thiohalomonadales bacterium]